MDRRRLGVIAGWVVATLAAMALASQAVGLVRDQVTDRPSQVPASLAASTTTATQTVTTTGHDPTSSTAATASTSTTTSTTSTTTTTTTTTTSVDASTSTTTTATPKTSTTTTLPPPPSNEVRTIYLTGGTVTARCSDNDVSWDSYVPNPGFSAEVENDGPVQLEIEFESRSHKSQLRATCDAGVLDVRAEEEREH